jgi:nucleotide-binding universal stress UspA family protein
MKTNTKTRSARGKLARTIRPSSARAPRQARGEVIELVPSLLKMRDVLVPTDFSAESRKALQYAARFAEQCGAKITLVHVVEPVATPDFAYFPLTMENDKVTKLARGKLDLLCKQEAIPPRVVAKTLVRFGKAYLEIARAARGLKSDLIIIATHGYTGVKHALLGSVTERVVRHAPCPVLVVRGSKSASS